MDAQKHGGLRKRRTWQEKLRDVDEDIVKVFVDNFQCTCGEKCMDKVRDLEDKGREMVTELRESKLSGNKSNVLICSLILYIKSITYNCICVDAVDGPMYRIFHE